MSARQRGVYEHPRGSNIWHINYYDREGKRHREKVGRQITTTVPAGATSGTVQVVTPGGTLSSNVPFRVTP